MSAADVDIGPIDPEHPDAQYCLAQVALYRSTGWVEVAPFNEEPFADQWLEKRLDS